MKARDYIDRAIAVMTENGDLYFAAELHRLSAVCNIRMSNYDKAIAAAHTALAVARSQGAKLFELRAALFLAEHGRDTFRAALVAALATFPEPEPWPEITAARRSTGLST